MNDTFRKTWPRRLLQGAALTAAIAVGIGAAQLAPMHAAFAADAVAGPHGDLREHHRAMMHDHLQRVLTDAGVGDAQRQKIDALLRAAMDDQHEDMERLHADIKLMKDLLVAPTIDTAKFNTVRAEQEQLAIQTSRRMADTALAIAQELTPPQRQALGAEIEQMFARHHGPFGGPPGEGPHGGGMHGDSMRGDGPRGEGPRGDGPPPPPRG